LTAGFDSIWATDLEIDSCGEQQRWVAELAEDTRNRAPGFGFESGLLLQLEEDLVNTTRGLEGNIRWRWKHYGWRSKRQGRANTEELL
jgi:hypothetical protein